MLHKIIYVFMIFSLCSIPLNVKALTETGGIEGNVIEQESRLPLEGATVHILGTEFTMTSDENGHFGITNVPPGMYTVEIYAPGYEVILKREIRVSPGKTLPLNIELQKDFIYTLDEIVVTATRMREKIKNPWEDEDEQLEELSRRTAKFRDETDK